MENLMAFLSGFVSYLLVFFVFIAVAFCGIKIGLFARKKKDASLEAVTDTNAEKE